jgi:hypothetical protein
VTTGCFCCEASCSCILSAHFVAVSELSSCFTCAVGSASPRLHAAGTERFLQGHRCHAQRQHRAVRETRRRVSKTFPLRLLKRIFVSYLCLLACLFCLYRARANLNTVSPRVRTHAVLIERLHLSCFRMHPCARFLMDDSSCRRITYAG